MTIENKGIHGFEDEPGGKQDLLGLQARLLCRNALDPNKKIYRELSSRDFRETSYQPFALLSDIERKNYWQGEEEDPRKQLEIWSVRLKEAVEKRKDKIVDGKKEDFYQRVFGIDILAFSEVDAQNVYKKYFNTSVNNSGIKMFVQDILNAYTDDASKDISTQSVKENLDEISWFAKIFGQKSGEIIANLVEAKAKVGNAVEREIFLNQINTKDADRLARVNNLNETEINLLEAIWEVAKDNQKPAFGKIGRVLGNLTKPFKSKKDNEIPLQPPSEIPKMINVTDLPYRVPQQRFEPQQTLPSSPNMMQNISEVLGKAQMEGQETVSYEASPSQLISYLKTVELPEEAKLKDAEAVINEKRQIVTKGTIGTSGGDISFEVVFENNGQDTQVVDKPDIKIPWKLKVARKSKQIEAMITNLNQLIKDNINKRLNEKPKAGSWKLNNFTIGEKALQLNFAIDHL